MSFLSDVANVIGKLALLDNNIKSSAGDLHALKLLHADMRERVLRLEGIVIVVQANGPKRLR